MTERVNQTVNVDRKPYSHAPRRENEVTDLSQSHSGNPHEVREVELSMPQLSTDRALVGVVLTLWLGIVVYLGAVGAFITAPGTIPIPIALGAGLPVVVFLALFLASTTFRNFLLSCDLPLMTAVQAWRFAGLGFIALYVHGVLPGSFAWPAGLGDMAIGLTAPWVALALIRRPEFATSRLFVIWNLLGMLDLVAAVSAGALNQVFATGAAGEISISPMAKLPLLLIPAYLVPLLFVLHITALFQARRLSRYLQG